MERQVGECRVKLEANGGGECFCILNITSLTPSRVSSPGWTWADTSTYFLMCLESSSGSDFVPVLAVYTPVGYARQAACLSFSWIYSSKLPTS